MIVTNYWNINNYNLIVIFCHWCKKN